MMLNRRNNVGTTLLIMMTLISTLILAGCGEDDNGGEPPEPTIEMVPDELEVASDDSTVLRTEVSGRSEPTILFETDLGGVGFEREESSEWTPSFGKVDIPFGCVGDVGTATITATWIEEEIQDSVEIECI